MTTTKKGQMLHKKSNVFGRVPSASTLGFGEIAVNYNEKEPFLAIKTSGETNNFEVVKISSDKIIEQKINDAVDKVGSELNELADIVSQNELVTADSLTELNDAINYVGSKFSDYATSADTSSAIKAVSAATSTAIKAVNDKVDAFSDTVVKTTPQTLSEGDKNQVKENLGISTPDWNAKEGEYGYIENRTHCINSGNFVELPESVFEYDDVEYEKMRYDFYIDNYASDPDYFIFKLVDPNNQTNETFIKIDYDKPQTLSAVLTKCYRYEEDHRPIYFDVIPEDRLIKIWFLGGTTDTMPNIYYAVKELSTNDYIKQLDEIYIPDTIARKSELDEVYSSAVTNTNMLISQFYFSGVLNLRYEQSDNTVYYKGIYGNGEWAALPVWVLNMYLSYTLSNRTIITAKMVMTSGDTYPKIINDFKIFSDETSMNQVKLSWSYDDKKYTLTFDGNGPRGQNIVVEQSLEAIVGENEEIVSSALNSLNDDIKQLYEIIEEGDGGVGNSVAIEAVSQVATDLYNFKNEVRTGITVYNSERIAGQTIDEIVAQIGGGSNGGGINPEYDSGSRAYVVGVDDDGNAYYSDVYMSGNTLNAPNGFFQQSDENLKIFISDIEVDLEKITQLPKKYFMWSDKRDENIHIGTSAQAVQELYPEIVKGDKNGNLTVDYSKLSVIALRAIDVLNEERKQMKADIAEIKTKLGL